VRAAGLLTDRVQPELADHRTQPPVRLVGPERDLEPVGPARGGALAHAKAPAVAPERVSIPPHVRPSARATPGARTAGGSGGETARPVRRSSEGIEASASPQGTIASKPERSPRTLSAKP